MQLNAHGDSCEDNIAQKGWEYFRIYEYWVLLYLLWMTGMFKPKFMSTSPIQSRPDLAVAPPLCFFRCRKPPLMRQYLSADWGPLGPHHLVVKVRTYQISQQKLWCCNIGVGDTVRFLFRVCLHKHLSVPICLMRGRRGKMESWWWAEVSLIFLWGRVTLRSVMFQVDMEDRIKW